MEARGVRDTCNEIYLFVYNIDISSFIVLKGHELVRDLIVSRRTMFNGFVDGLKGLNVISSILNGEGMNAF